MRMRSPPANNGAATPVRRLNYRPEIELPVQFAQATSSVPDQAQVPDSILRRLGADDPQRAGDLGTEFLERALVARRDQPELLDSHILLSLVLLRRAAAEPRLRQSLENGTENQNYATILGNLALAESLGSKQQIGSDSAARSAILASTALGGSSTAYELAAHYALAEGDALAAVGLFSRAYGTVQGTGSRVDSIRRALDRGYQLALAKTSLSKIEIAQFDPSQLPNADASQWRRLATRWPINFEFKGRGSRSTHFLLTVARVTIQPRRSMRGLRAFRRGQSRWWCPSPPAARATWSRAS